VSDQTPNSIDHLPAPARRHVESLTDPFQRELWEYRDGTNADPARYER